MPNFKVGDRVRFTGKRWFSKGEIVTIDAVDPADSTCTYRCSDGVSKCWVQNENIEPISKFSVGQIYKVGNIGDDRNGEIIKIVSENGGWGRPFTYKVIRGEHDTQDRFAPNSIFAENITLLTGKEIGEAIKAFDDRKTGGVKEVKRRAKKGEYLKVVDASTDEGYNYSNGDILKCTFVGSCGIQARSGAKYGTLVDHEYAVLEGYKPENNGRIYIGGKHVWTPEEVERAKTIVLDTIREIYEESKGSVAFSRDVYSDKIFDAYLIEKGYSKLGYRPLDDTVIAHKARKGTAKCSPTDEPNVWIGKCVALCKALHKPIPSFIMGD